MTWWTSSCFHEVYVRSSQDSNDDGVGDLNGITSRLPYLQDLGIGAIWMTPFHPSQHVDFGYDVSDHEARSIRTSAAWPTSIGSSRKRTGAGFAWAGRNVEKQAADPHSVSTSIVRYCGSAVRARR
jgi:hypothetical protein